MIRLPATLRPVFLFLTIIGATLWWSSAAGQVPDLNRGSVPTLAPLVREVTPAVVNISVRGRVKEDNPLYRDPFFREFFDLPRQFEREIQAT